MYNIHVSLPYRACEQYIPAQTNVDVKSQMSTHHSPSSNSTHHKRHKQNWRTSLRHLSTFPKAFSCQPHHSQTHNSASTQKLRISSSFTRHMHARGKRRTHNPSSSSSSHPQTVRLPKKTKMTYTNEVFPTRSHASSSARGGNFLRKTRQGWRRATRKPPRGTRGQGCFQRLERIIPPKEDLFA